MTFALDATYSLGPNLSGVGVYSREILTGLASAHPDARFLHAYRAHRFLEGWRSRRPANVSARPLFEWWQPWSGDMFHGLNQRMPMTRFRSSVCTFHDLFVMTGEYSTPEFRARFTEQARAAGQRADLIIAVSHFTATQVQQLLGVEPSRLRVIHHGIRFPAASQDLPREPIVLHVGAIQTRKNLVRLVDAFEKALPPPWRLVLAGSDGFGSEAVKSRIAASPARDRIATTGWVDDAGLQMFYRKASMLAFPSLDEGFGIPVLEAMAQGLPVVASNRGALPEVCGEAALVIDATDEDALAVSLARLASDELLRRDLIANGRRRAEMFSWARAVERTWAVYSELTGRE